MGFLELSGTLSGSRHDRGHNFLFVSEFTTEHLLYVHDIFFSSYTERIKNVISGIFAILIILFVPNVIVMSPLKSNYFADYFTKVLSIERKHDLMNH